MSMVPFRLSRRALLGSASLLAVPLGGRLARAAESDFQAFLAGVRRDAAAQGVRPGTLAFGGRRGPRFRGELIASLKSLDQGNVRPNAMMGSWAGAMGQCQFMPTTYLSYAVDFDGDGRRDIWNDRADVLGSIANYISRLGWRGEESWGREVAVPGNFDDRLAGLDNRRSTVEWSRLGARPVGGAAFTGREPAASPVLPDR